MVRLAEKYIKELLQLYPIMFRKLRPEKYRKDLNQLLEMGTTISEIKNTLKENTRDKDFNERLYMIKEKINELEDIAIETIVDI